MTVSEALGLIWQEFGDSVVQIGIVILAIGIVAVLLMSFSRLLHTARQNRRADSVIREEPWGREATHLCEDEKKHKSWKDRDPWED